MDAALEASRRAAPLRSGLTVALCGPPNVGKSTLFNALLGHERALTAPEPGTTRDYLAESLDAGGLKLTLVDTAGYRDAADAVEAAGVRRAGEWARAADVLLWVEAADEPSAGLPDALADLQPLRVMTRCDLLEEWPEARVGGELASPRDGGSVKTGGGELRPYPDSEVFLVSGTTGRGVPELWAALSALPGQLGEPALDSFGARQAQAVQQAREALQRARAALGQGMPLDAAAVDLYAAADALHGVFEQHDRARVIEQIFSGFCVGK
jgi:tRNA modification GTPase